MSEDRLKIAVFIDFDNIEIGVKTTLNARFDVGGVLEAIKERGEVVSKSAYGDWTRATEYGRSMSAHAIHMVQRNLTPGGDKNGADINLALDALEMAFTHSHINAFVIVGGDSDFITLVEKLKQYDRKVFVVGGRAFTSHVMQRNCTEFIAYEDITGTSSRGGRQSERGGRQTGEQNLAAAMPLIRRALKVLADREVLPQLGLLKSTLLQLDSTFSERAYGVGSFRDFVQKLAKAGYVTLKGTDRSFHVELREAGEAAATTAAPTPPPAAPQDGEGPPRLGPVEGFRVLRAAFTRPGMTPRFPMYVRQVKQFIRQVDENFDERKYGFSGMVDALRYGQREGLFRLDRDRQGVVRVYPGLSYPKPGDAVHVGEPGSEETTHHDYEPGVDGELFPPVDAAPGQDVPDTDADAVASDGHEADVETITYDVVTHVDADSGVIDVAPHETRAAGDGPGDEAPDASAGADPSASGGGRRRRKPAAGRQGGRRPAAAKPTPAPAGDGEPSAGRRRGANASSGSRRRRKPAGEPQPE